MSIMRRALLVVLSVAVAGLLVESGALAQTAPPGPQAPKAQARPTPPPAPQPPMNPEPGMVQCPCMQPQPGMRRGPGMAPMGQGQGMGPMRQGQGMGPMRQGQGMGQGRGMGPMRQGQGVGQGRGMGPMRQGQQQMARRQPMQAAGMAGVMRRLNLTQAQQDQLKLFRDQGQKEMTAAREKLQTAQQKFRETMDAPIPDEAAVRAAGLAMATAQADQMALQARSRAQLIKVLTPEQQQQFRQLQQRMNRMGRRQMPR